MTLGELSRRLDAMEHRVDQRLDGISQAINSLRFVHVDQYRAERDELRRRVEDLDEEIKELKADRKWIVRAAVTAILSPLVVALAVALILGGTP